VLDRFIHSKMKFKEYKVVISPTVTLSNYDDSCLKVRNLKCLDYTFYYI
jgi:hypothetical protein